MFGLSSPTAAQVAAVTEVITPRINDAHPAAGATMIDALGLAGVDRVALEIAAEERSCRFLIRAGDEGLQEHLERQVGTTYPLAGLRRLDATADPALARPDEELRAAVLTLAAPSYLPLRTFAATAAGPQAPPEPIRGLIAAASGLPPGWRALMQAVLAPAPRGWDGGIARRLDAAASAASRPPERERGGRASEAASLGPVGPILAAVAALSAWQALRRMWDDGERLPIIGGGALLLVALAALVTLAIAVGRRRSVPACDPALIRQKLGRTAYTLELRLAIFAPAGTDPGAMDARLDQIARAYGQYARPDGNRLVACAFDGGRLARERGLHSLAPLTPRRRRAIATAVEIAGLWHLPRVAAEIPLLEQTGARQRAPRPVAVARGCLIGHHEHQGRRLPVRVSDEALDHHAILVAATRAGKSSLMLVLARHLMERRPRRGTLVVIDPQRQLARAALGLVPANRRGDVVAIDCGDVARPVGLNLLDTGLGWARDTAVERVLALFRRQWPSSFGPRMEDLFAFGLATLYAANEALCRLPDGRDRPQGRPEQYTILDLVPLYAYPAFRNALLATLRDPDVVAWGEDYAAPLRQQDLLTWVNPVLNKVNAFGRSHVARALVGQPRSTIDPRGWLDRDRIVIVGGAQGEAGAEITALVGAALFNILTETLAERDARDPAECPPVTIIADEFQSLPGADFERVLAQQGKFGARLVLATQTLSGLERFGSADRPRNLRAAIFANAYSHFVYHCSAEDARFLVSELGGPGVVDVEDLVGLAKYHCYCRLPHEGVRPPAFLARLDPPPPSDPDWAAALARESAAAWGRPRALVEEDRDRARARIALMRTGGVRDEVPGDGRGRADAGEHSPAAPAVGHRPRPRRSNVFAQGGSPATAPGEEGRR